MTVDEMIEALRKEEKKHSNCEEVVIYTRDCEIREIESVEYNYAFGKIVIKYK